MQVIESSSLDTIYFRLLSRILNAGTKVSPRGMETLELHPVTVVLNNPVRNIIASSVRALNPMFMISEFLWIFSGRNDVSFVSKFNKNIAQFSDDGSTFNGAYGPRLYDYHGVNQLQFCFDKLKESFDTRQASMVIFDPSIDCVKKTVDFPCNQYLKFTVRDKKLDMSVYVRSQDMIWGFPYDCFNWTLLQQQLANMLNITCGKYFHIIDSAHIYAHHYELAKKIISDRRMMLDFKIDIKCASFSEFKLVCSELIKSIEQNQWDILKTEKLKNSIFANQIAEMFNACKNNQNAPMKTINPLMHLYLNYAKKKENSKKEKA